MWNILFKSVLNKKITCILYDKPSYFGKIINILQSLQSVCKLLTSPVNKNVINLNNTYLKKPCDSIALPRVQRQVDHTVELHEIKYIWFNNVLAYLLTMYRLKSHRMLPTHVYFIHSNNISELLKNILCLTFLKILACILLVFVD